MTDPANNFFITEKKGGAYGVSLTQNRAGHMGNASRRNLEKHSRSKNHNCSGCGEKTASGVSPALAHLIVQPATVALLSKGRFGRKGMPADLIARMYADYLQLNSLSLVGKKYGRTRQSMFSIFRDNGFKLNAKPALNRIEYGGKIYTPGKNGYYRCTQGARTPLHQQMWLDAGNVIPKGWQVSFKDGDHDHLQLANLFCDSVIGVTLYHQRRLGTKIFKTPEQRRQRNNELAKAWHAKKRRQFLAQGLTTKGKPRQRKPNFIDRSQSPVVQQAAVQRQLQNTRQNVLANYHRRADRFEKQGLTSRGTVRKRARKFFKRTEFDKAWEAVRATMHVRVIGPDDFVREVKA